MGGPEGGAGTNPEQLFAAGYAACFNGAMAVAAQRLKVGAEGSEVTAKVSIGRNGEGGFGLAVELLVKIPGLEREKAVEVVETAHQICPYSNATRGNVDVQLTVL
jgi:lipoyl-dependent peroxiredoxin